MSTRPIPARNSAALQSDAAQPKTNGFESAQVKHKNSPLKVDKSKVYTAFGLQWGAATTPKINNKIMSKTAISAETAARYDLDQDEVHLVLLYAKASKEATLRALTATPEEIARLKGMRRLASLTFDLYQRLKVAMQLPDILTNKQQADLAGQLSGTFDELCKLEKALFGEQRTAKDRLVTEANSKRRTWDRHQPNLSSEPETPKRRSRGKKLPNFAT